MSRKHIINKFNIVIIVLCSIDIITFSSHLDCPDVIERIWHQRLELRKPFGVLVSCKLVNYI